MGFVSYMWLLKISVQRRQNFCEGKGSTRTRRLVESIPQREGENVVVGKEGELVLPENGKQLQLQS